MLGTHSVNSFFNAALSDRSKYLSCPDPLSRCCRIGLAPFETCKLEHLRSGFHVAEHLTFKDLRVFVQQALRVSQPARLLILETHNPENIRVGTAEFYLHPTHRRPLPPPLLSFLTEFCGFLGSKNCADFGALADRSLSDIFKWRQPRLRADRSKPR